MRLYLIALFILLYTCLAAQPVNQTDAQGRKQGVWKKNFDNSAQLRYEGQFKDNQPTGLFKYYDLQGKVMSTVQHLGNGVSYSVNYLPNGKKISEGKFINQKKDSTWTIYGEDEQVLSRDNYSTDRKHGTSTTYHTNGKPLLEQNFLNGVAHGKMTAWYESGTVKNEDHYINGVLQGVSRAFNQKGVLILEGSYTDGVKKGEWKSFNDDGTLRAILVYDGEDLVAVNRMNGVFEDFFPNELVKARYTYQNGKKHGPFTEYHPGGSWKTEERTDPRTGDKDTYRVPVNHNISRKGSYLNDQLHGKVEQFSPQGAPEPSLNFINGRIQ